MLMLLLLMIMMEMVMVYSEEDILSQYRALIGVSRGSAIIKLVFYV